MRKQAKPISGALHNGKRIADVQIYNVGIAVEHGLHHSWVEEGGIRQNKRQPSRMVAHMLRPPKECYNVNIPRITGLDALNVLREAAIKPLKTFNQTDGRKRQPVPEQAVQ